MDWGKGVIIRPKVEQHSSMQSCGATGSLASREEASRIRLIGNQAFGEGCFEDAIAHYTRALLADPLATDALCNRSLAHLKLGQSLQALSDAVTALGINPRNTKALFRVGSALEAQGAHALALEYYERSPLGPDAAASIERCNAAISSGKVNRSVDAFKSRFGQCVVRDQPGEQREPAAVARVLGPFTTKHPVSIRAASGGIGIGMFAARDITRSSVVYMEYAPLVVSPAGGLRRCYHCALPLPASEALRVHCSGGCGVLFCSGPCKAEAERLYHIPICRGGALEALERAVDALPTRHLHAKIHIVRGTLHHALKLVGWAITAARLYPDHPRAAPGSALACAPSDAGPYGRLARTCDLSAATSAPGPRLFHLAHSLIMHEAMCSALGPLAIDPALAFGWLCIVESLVLTNAFGLTDPAKPEGGAARASALCIVSSLFNHSCEPNLCGPPPGVSNIDKTGNMHVLFAARDIRAGEELFTSYTSLDASTEDRRHHLAAQYNFVCTCTRCGPAPPPPLPAEWLIAPHPGF